MLKKLQEMFFVEDHVVLYHKNNLVYTVFFQNF